MQTMLLQPSPTKLAGLTRLQRHRQHRLAPAQSQSGRSEPFNEGAVQVKRLVDRDRQQMLGNKIDILDKFETEFGDPSDETSTTARPAATATATATAAPAAPSTSTASTSSSSSSSSSNGSAAKPAAPTAVKTNFGGSAGMASPFGSPSRPVRSMMEPKGLSPDMSPDPIIKLAPTPGNLLSKITLTQVVLFCTFSSMIGLMLATFSVVVKSGAVRLAGIE